MTSFTHIKLDLSKNRYKRFYRFLGFPMSDGWKKLPVITKVALSKVKVSQTFHSARTMGNSSTIHDEMYAIFLLGNSKSIRIEAGKFKDLNEAQSDATKLAEHLGVMIIDFTK